MKALLIERAGSREDFAFTLKGVVDLEGARAVDRLLLTCQARGAQRVRLDFTNVESVSSQGIAVLTRWGRMYEKTERLIEIEGLGAEIRLALQQTEAVVYIPNRTGARVPEPDSSGHAADPLDPTADFRGPTAGFRGQAAGYRGPDTTGPDTAGDFERAELPGASARAAAARGPAAPATRQDDAPSREPGAFVAREPERMLPETFADAPASAGAPVGPEMASLQSKLKRKIVEFRNLFEITQALNLAQDLDEVVNLFGLSVMGQFGLERLALFLVDPDKEGNLVPKHARGFAANHFLDFIVPWTAFRKFGPERSVVALQELEIKANGSEVLEALRESGLEWAVLLWVRRDLEGVLFLGGRGSRRSFEEDERDLVTILSHQGAVAISNARVQRAVEERNLGLVRGMMALIESRDGYAKGSTERVVRYVSAVARLLDYPKEHLKSLVYGAVLRDIGMITVSGLVLKNPAHLSEEEWSLIKQHPIRGAQILEEMNFPREVIAIVLNHHERWGGEGYPHGVRGQDIPLGARIVSLVDAYVAMTSERPYRRALPYEKARQVIAENWGSPFDPSVIEVFLSVLDKIERRSRLKAGQPPPAADPAPAADAPGSAPAALDPLSSGATIPTESPQ